MLVIEDKGSDQTVDEDIEMQDSENDDEAETKNDGLIKGGNLQSPSISRQYGLKRVTKTLSLSSPGTESSLAREDDTDHP
ncbi:hypothetical protein ACSBR1_003795 [Camellia fascicularis]